MINTYVESLLLAVLLAVIFWVISVKKKDVSIVDSAWSLFFIVIASYIYTSQASEDIRSGIVLLLVYIWGLRLSFYITYRHWGKPEDHRYQTIRQNNEPYFAYKSLYLIFIFQAVVAWIIAIPLYYAIISDQSWSWLDWVGLGLWTVGFCFESIADYQLWSFKKKEINRGKICTTGLWRYTRHPNYFGEFLIWWGFFCLSLSPGQYFTIISPIIMTFLLMKFSGVALLEKTMVQRNGYEDYIKQTNAFFPGFNFVNRRDQ
jgi:steroid 5-alpha reductase family enzyme